MAFCKKHKQEFIQVRTCFGNGTYYFSSRCPTCAKLAKEKIQELTAIHKKHGDAVTTRTFDFPSVHSRDWSYIR